VIVSEHAFREAALTVHRKLEHSVAVLYDIACGKDLKKFLTVRDSSSYFDVSIFIFFF
jgi:glutaredoxin-related protein